MKYSLVYNWQTQADTLDVDTLTYDADPTRLGLLSSDCNQLAQCQNFSYDARGSESSVTFSDSTPSRSMLYDPDSRVVSVTSSVFGAQSYTYDADGRLSTSQDPTGGGVTSPALLTHHYYADGEEESLDVASSALSQSGLFTYSYRPDGRVQTQAIDDASVAGIVNPGTTALSYTYTAAGRMTQRSESGAAANGTPVAASYNGYGQETAETTPGVTLSPFEYSAQGEDLGTLTSVTGQNHTAFYTYSVRGELTSWPAPNDSSAGASSRYANGVQIQGQSGRTQSSTTWDSRMGVALASTAGTGGSGSTMVYDAAGRLITDSQCCDVNGLDVTTTRTFDAENHTLESGQMNYGLGHPVGGSILWGPNGHPAMVGSWNSTMNAFQYDTLHWNGGVLLFTTNSSGQLDDIKIGAQGDILPLDSGYKGLTFYDRDPAGGVMGCHNAAGATFAGLSTSYTFNTKYGAIQRSPCYTTNGNMPTSVNWWGSVSVNGGGGPSIGQGGVLGMPRTDGYTDGYDTIQGVRTYDSNAGTWTTPDAYAGNVDDPASQKSYMWNGNNPEAYGDPTGFTAWLGFATASPVPVWISDHAFIQVNSKTFEDGPLPANWFVVANGLSHLHKASYGDDVRSNAASSTVIKGDTVILAPPKGTSQGQWESIVSGTCTRLQNEIDSAYVPYGRINSNTFVAEALHRLGYSDTQIATMMNRNSPALGSDPGSVAELEFWLEAESGGGFDFGTIAPDGGGDGNAAAGMGAQSDRTPF